MNIPYQVNLAYEMALTTLLPRDIMDLERGIWDKVFPDKTGVSTKQMNEMLLLFYFSSVLFESIVDFEREINTIVHSWHRNTERK